MERPACIKDYENIAKKHLSAGVFSHINGLTHPDEGMQFNAIQLKLRGLANLKYFTDPISKKLLGSSTAYASPIGLGGFPH